MGMRAGTADMATTAIEKAVAAGKTRAVENGMMLRTVPGTATAGMAARAAGAERRARVLDRPRVADRRPRPAQRGTRCAVPARRPETSGSAGWRGVAVAALASAVSILGLVGVANLAAGPAPAPLPAEHVVSVEHAGSAAGS
ncbi:hypothetical protein [Rhodococcus rhodnii]|nr:hypothetical protein [Rhodococcus rhodnii]